MSVFASATRLRLDLDRLLHLARLEEGEAVGVEDVRVLHVARLGRRLGEDQGRLVVGVRQLARRIDQRPGEAVERHRVLAHLARDDGPRLVEHLRAAGHREGVKAHRRRLHLDHRLGRPDLVDLRDHRVPALRAIGGHGGLEDLHHRGLLALHLLLLGGLPIKLRLRGGHVELARENAVDGLVQPAHRVADPEDLTVLHEEGRRDAVLPGGLHEPGVHRLRLAVEGDVVVHFGTHRGDELLHLADLIDPVLPHGDAGEVDLAPVLVGHLGQVRDADLARAAPGGPELDDVDALGEVHGLALHHRGDLEDRGLAADAEAGAEGEGGEGESGAIRKRRIEGLYVGFAIAKASWPRSSGTSPTLPSPKGEAMTRSQGSGLPRTPSFGRSFLYRIMALPLGEG